MEKTNYLNREKVMENLEILEKCLNNMVERTSYDYGLNDRLSFTEVQSLKSVLIHMRTTHNMIKKIKELKPF